jgi:hypothetical protein
LRRFAHLKTHHGFERMRLRGLCGARDEFHLAAIVQNLKTLALRSLVLPAALPLGLLRETPEDQSAAAACQGSRTGDSLVMITPRLRYFSNSGGKSDGAALRIGANKGYIAR